MQVYETNSGLGYNQYAYVIKVEEGLFVVGSLNNNLYVVGDFITDIEDIILYESIFTLEDSPLYGTYLFEYFIARDGKWLRNNWLNEWESW